MALTQTFYASATATASASIDDIWEVITDVDGWPNWDQRLERVELTGDICPDKRFNLFLTDNLPVVAVVKDLIKNQHFSYETKSSTHVIRHDVELSILGSKVKVNMTAQSEIPVQFAENFTTSVWPRFQIGLGISLSNLVTLVDRD